MILAESIADNVNWSLIAAIVMTVATVGMWLDARKSRVTQIEQPLSITGTPMGNAEIQRDLKNMNHRLNALEAWRGELIQKLDDDKSEMLQAGESRASRIHEHIETDRRELENKINVIPDRIIAMLRNLGAIK